MKVNNWYIVPFVYYRLVKKDFFILNLRNGLNIKLRTFSTDIQAFVNVWILEEYNKEGFKIKDRDVVIDIGGHIGLFTIYASHFCKRGKIFTFEPVKENYKILRENISINNLQNVSAFNVAVSDKNDRIKIYLNDNDQAAHSIFENGHNFIETDSLSLKEIMDLNSIDKCDLVKLDCEGAEYEILRALPQDYFKKIDKICLEYHLIQNDFTQLKELKLHLTNLGFSITDIPYSDGSGLLFAISTDTHAL